jgi:cytochrome bd-type quinol oxidase subunit 1
VGEPPVSAVPSTTHIIATRFLLFAFQITLLFGLILAVVGYIGCFSVVQASPREDPRGVLVWLVCEALLAVLRTLVWAANPKWDDAKSPIALEKVATTTESKTEDMKKASSYGIGWMLSSVTANDMHALIVGINKFGESSKFHDLDECVPDAKRIASYLKDTLLVPRDQIVTLYDSEATKEHITQALRDLSHKSSVAADAPIIIYLASHTGIRHVEGTDKKQMYLVPHCGASEAEKDAYISYDSIVDMIGHIADNKTDNIVSANFTLGV